MAEAILDMLRRNVGDNLKMNPAAIRARIARPVTRVAVELAYRDRAGNEYEPARATVEVVDRRSRTSGADVEIPLTIAGVDESAAYKNVRAMEIGPGE